jgi:hypothetical protein
VDVRFGVPDRTEGTFAVPIGSGILYALLAEQMGAGVEGHFLFPA